MEKQKRCSHCQELKDLDQFWNNRSTVDGKHAFCKLCGTESNNKYRISHHDERSAYNRNWRKRNPDKCKAYVETQRTKDQTLEGKFGRYAHSRNAKKLGFSLTLQEFATFWQKPCFYCGTPILTIGLDRIDSKIGYSLTNCVSCCELCNYMKNDLPQHQWLCAMRCILTHQGYTIM